MNEDSPKYGMQLFDSIEDAFKPSACPTVKKLKLTKFNSMTKKVKAPQTANDLTTVVINLLTLEGFKVWRVNNNAIYDVKKRIFRKNPSKLLGVSDIGGHLKKSGKYGIAGRSIYVEIKAGNDTLSPEQRNFLLEAAENGCIAFECKHIDDVINKLVRISLHLNP